MTCHPVLLVVVATTGHTSTNSEAKQPAVVSPLDGYTVLYCRHNTYTRYKHSIIYHHDIVLVHDSHSTLVCRHSFIHKTSIHYVYSPANNRSKVQGVRFAWNCCDPQTVQPARPGPHTRKVGYQGPPTKNIGAHRRCGRIQQEH